MKFGEIIQSADWKTEKHVPMVEAPDKVKAGEKFSFHPGLSVFICGENDSSDRRYPSAGEAGREHPRRAIRGD